jgi:hypothetical protein
LPDIDWLGYKAVRFRDPAMLNDLTRVIKEGTLRIGVLAIFQATKRSRKEARTPLSKQKKLSKDFEFEPIATTYPTSFPRNSNVLPRASLAASAS